MQSRWSGVLKIIAYNLLVFFVIVNVFYWSIPTVAAISSLFRTTGIPVDGPKIYKSFVGWQVRDIKSPDLNVEGPYAQRRTLNENARGNQKVYFFGGSTMWGSFVADGKTIPSQFAQLTGLRSENFGQPGYTAHQSLMLLLQLLQDGHRPDAVVFYEGVNDVWAKCYRYNNAHSHIWEHEFQGALFQGDPNSFSQHFRAVMRLAEKIRREASKAADQGVFDCVGNQDKAEAIAENLILDWRFARQLVQPYGIRFIGILQPVMFQSRSRRDDIKFSPGLDRQFDTLYPLIKAKLAHEGGLHDLVSVLDGEERAYIDFCHVNDDGNRLIAQRIAALTGAALGSGGP